MSEYTSVHANDHQACTFHPSGVVPWREATPPDIQAGRTTGHLKTCSYCGSMHPADLAAAIRAGATGSFADWKYGWPHKAYFDGIPNPHAGMLESRCSKSHPTQQEIDSGAFIQVPDGFDPRTGKPVSRWVEAGKPAPATTSWKFYTVHLQDATPEDRDTIERALGLRFKFDGRGVSWEQCRPASAVIDLTSEAPITDAKACPASGDEQCEACQ